MAPRSFARGAPQSGDLAAAEMPERAKIYMGRQQPATGSHLPSEDTALPCAVAPFASSPFAHPIPQSHHRASGDLFSASSDQNSPESFSVTRVACLPAQVCAIIHELLLAFIARVSARAGMRLHRCEPGTAGNGSARKRSSPAHR